MASFISYFVILALAVNTATALQCYSCNSKDNSACRWGTASFTYDIEQCVSAGPTLDSVVAAKCYNITAKNKEGQEYIARGCQNPPALSCHALAAAVGWISEKSSSDPHAVSQIECQTCDTDKCNSNSASKLAGITFLGVLLATFAFTF